MSCCGGNCGCGPNCKCVKGCSGCCKMYPDMEQSFSEISTTQTTIFGVAPQKMFSEGSEMGMGGENGCKCTNCTCDPCTCK